MCLICVRDVRVNVSCTQVFAAVKRMIEDVPAC